MSEQIVDINDANFQSDVLDSSTPVLVDFWAPWCGPCRAIAPMVDEIAKEYSGRLIVAKMNVDDNTETPAKYGVRGIPNLILFKNGEACATHTGSLSKSQLSALIDSHL